MIWLFAYAVGALITSLLCGMLETEEPFPIVVGWPIWLVAAIVAAPFVMVHALGNRLARRVTK